ncbi:MAG: hypothetical protein AB9897_03000 [Anaerolineaceae bacterium]
MMPSKVSHAASCSAVSGVAVGVGAGVSVGAGVFVGSTGAAVCVWARARAICASDGAQLDKNNATRTSSGMSRFMEPPVWTRT